MSALRLLCLILLIQFFAACVSYEEHGNQDTQFNALSTLKVDMMRERSRGRKMGVEEVANGDMKKKKEALMKLKNQAETTKNSFTSVPGREKEVEEEDGLVAYTADYWRARHHPPKNN